ncbi:MAG TPA: hypothetical protein PKA22_11930 [Rhodocyclaceae bacterium]|nr:hypothetical protein [Rhodocyclaceae bacterium]
MSLATLEDTDWGAIALVVILAVAFVWALVFFLRQNRKDLESLKETLNSEQDDADR